MAFEMALPNCLICGVVLEDRKPVVVTEIVREQLATFKQSFQCFCRLLEVKNPGVVDSVVEEALATMMTSRPLRTAIKEEDDNEQLFFGLPCCEQCCGALNDIESLQKTIDEIKANQMGHVNELKTSLLSVGTKNDETDLAQIRKSLITNIPTIIVSDPPVLKLPETSPAPSSLPNFAQRRSSRKANLKEMTPTYSDLPILEPPSPPPPLSPPSWSPPPASPVSVDPLLPTPRKRRRKQDFGKGRNESKNPAAIKANTEEPFTITRPCSVTLKRIKLPLLSNVIKEPENVSMEEEPLLPVGHLGMRKSKQKAYNFIKRNTASHRKSIIDDDDDMEPLERDPLEVSDNEEDFQIEIKKEKSQSSSFKRKKDPSRRVQPARYFSLITENILLYRYTLIKVSRGGTQFSCMNHGCSTILRDPDWHALFKKMQAHIDKFHILKKNTVTFPSTCPLCQQKFINAHLFRAHLNGKFNSGHQLDTVVCESCWKPIRNQGDNYRAHAWRHMNDKEQQESPYGPPCKVVKKMENLGQDYVPRNLDSMKSLAVKMLKSNKKKKTKKVSKVGSKRKRKGAVIRRGRLNRMFWLVNDNLLIYMYTLIEYSHGGTKLHCLEDCCGFEVQDFDYLNLFEKMRSHVDVSHVSESGDCNSDKVCPHSSCHFQEAPEGTSLRAHLKKVHGMKAVICDICWKSVNHLGDNYRYHKWFHKNAQEQADSMKTAPSKVITRSTMKKDFKKQESLGKGGNDMGDRRPSGINIPLGIEKDAPVDIEMEVGGDLESESVVLQLLQEEMEDTKLENTMDDFDLDECPEKDFEEDPMSPEGDSGAKGKKNDDDDFVPSPDATESENEEDNEEDDDDDDDYVPSSKKSKISGVTTRRSYKKDSSGKSTMESPAIKGKSQKLYGTKPTPLFWIVTDTTLIYRYTLVQASLNGTHLKCLENSCSFEVHDFNYFHLFEQMKSHVEEFHYSTENNDETSFHSIPCPHSHCQETCLGGANLRKHLARDHGMLQVICEICWKSMPNWGGNYPAHKGTHKNAQEQTDSMDSPSPAYLKKVKVTGRKGKQCKPQPKPKLCRVQNVITRKQNIWMAEDCFRLIREDLLLFKLTVLKIDYNQAVTCLEPGCGTVITDGTDFMAFQKVKVHVNECHVTNKDTISRECPLCDDPDKRSFEGKELLTHLFQSGQHDEKAPYFCESCLKPCKGKASLKNHKKTHRNKEGLKKEEFPCPDCGRIFNTSNLYKAHAPTHWPKHLRKQFPCPHCPATLLCPAALANHVERLHRPDLKKYRYCTICNRRFNHREGTKLKLHIMSHRNERPHVCDVCGKDFASPAQFRKHQEKAHSNERMYQCEYCEMNYKYPNNLVRHKQSAHKDKVPKLDPDKGRKYIPYEYTPDFIGPRIMYPCEFCDKIFHLRSRMTKHVKLVHTGGQ